MKTLLTVPDADSAHALTLGALFDASTRTFHAPAGTDLSLFGRWLPAGASTELVAAARGMSLSQLLARITAAISHAFPASEWVRVEISSLTKRNEHVYLDVVERDAGGTEVAKTRAVIWKGRTNKIGEKFFKATGVHLSDGMKVLVAVEPQYKAQYGLSLVITDIDPEYTLGDMEAKLRQIRKEIEALGIGDRNKNLVTPVDFFRVAVIAPDGAAGLEDFKMEADRLAVNSLCHFEYFHAIFQGERAEQSVLQAFVEAHQAHKAEAFDAIVVIRGGGAKSDLQWLNHSVLARAVCRSHVPVFVGIGHERDSTILDEYAHRSLGTPSKVIAHICNAIAGRANRGFEDWLAILKTAESRLQQARIFCAQLMDQTTSSTEGRLREADLHVERDLFGIRTAAANGLTNAGIQTDAIHREVVNAALGKVDQASTKATTHFVTLRDRARALLETAEERSDNYHSSVVLAARRTIDGIDEHLNSHRDAILHGAVAAVSRIDEVVHSNMNDILHEADRSLVQAQRSVNSEFDAILSHGKAAVVSAEQVVTSHWRDIANDATVATRQANAEVERHFADVRQCTYRNLQQAQQGAESLVASILSLGVAPTLKRGFAIVKADGQPVSSKASAQLHLRLEIQFHDGTINVQREE